MATRALQSYASPTAVGAPSAFGLDIAGFFYDRTSQSLKVVDATDGTKTVQPSVLGSSSTPISFGTTAGNFSQKYVETEHTTGDFRLAYWRTYFSGAGGSGETARIFSTINNVTVATGGTVNGAHISLSATGASAGVSGAANALRCTLGLAASVGALGGTVAVVQIDTDIAAGPTIPARTAFIRFDNVGTQKLSYAFTWTNADTDNMFVGNTDTPDKGLLVSINGTDYWLMVSQATS